MGSSSHRRDCLLRSAPTNLRACESHNSRSTSNQLLACECHHSNPRITSSAMAPKYYISGGSSNPSAKAHKLSTSVSLLLRSLFRSLQNMCWPFMSICFNGNHSHKSLMFSMAAEFTNSRRLNPRLSCSGFLSYRTVLVDHICHDSVLTEILGLLLWSNQKCSQTSRQDSTHDLALVDSILYRNLVDHSCYRPVMSASPVWVSRGRFPSGFQKGINQCEYDTW